MEPQGRGNITSRSLVAAAFAVLLLTAATAGCIGTDRHQQDGEIVVAHSADARARMLRLMRMQMEMSAGGVR